MPKRKLDEESDYEDDGSDHDDSSGDNGAYDEEEDTKPPPKKAASKKPSAAMKQAWRDIVTSKGDNSDRITENGGYAHTLDSKMKISRANKGNTPWNKGKQRSAADRAKIGAGVRARNRAILLDKLKKIGMTEDEWFAKKKQLKYLRERVRKAKKAKDDKALEEHQKKLQSALDEQDKINNQSSSVGTEKSKKKPPTLNAKTNHDNKAAPKLTKKADPPKPPKTKVVEKKFVNFKSKLRNGKPPNRRRSSSSRASKGPGGVRIKDIFARDVTFQEHPFQTSDLENPYEICPNGGPGGLICCAACTTTYSSFLTSTAKDIEEQKTKKVNKEVSELLGFLSGAKTKLDDALRLAKQRSRVGPLHRPQKAHGGRPTDTRKVRQEEEVPPRPVEKLREEGKPAYEEVMQELTGLFQQTENEQPQQPSPEEGLQRQVELAEPQHALPSVFRPMVDTTPIDFTLELPPAMEEDRGAPPAEEERNPIELVAV